MELNEIYTVVNPTSWNAFIPLYIFLKGLSVGAFIVSALYTVFGFKSFRSLAWPSAVASVVFLALVPIMLFADLGQPGRFWHLLVPWYFNFTSPMSWGSWLLVLYPIVLLRYTYLLYKARPALPAPASAAAKEMAATLAHGPAASENTIKLTGLVVLPVAVATDVYTGFLLGVIKANALWNSALLPINFLVSAILSGAAAVVLMYLLGLARAKQDKLDSNLLGLLGQMMLVLIAVEIFFVISQWLVLGMGGQQAGLVLKLLLSDPLYILGEVVAGLVIPLLILLSSRARSNTTWLTVGSLLVLAGSFLMRYTLIFKGLEASRLVG